jgi:hypothetical protein
MVFYSFVGASLCVGVLGVLEVSCNIIGIIWAWWLSCAVETRELLDKQCWFCKLLQ